MSTKSFTMNETVLGSNPNTIAKVWQRASLVDVAYETILEAIVDQQLPPGSRLNIDALSLQLNMSNTPIREALARLTSTALVKQISNRGFMVAPILSEVEYHHLFAARRLLETNALREATFDAATLDSLQAIAQAIASMEYGTTYKRFIGNLQVDESFHLALLKASGNQFLVAAWNSLHFYSHISRLHTQEESIRNNSYKTSLSDHGDIVRLLRAGDRVAAVARLDSHILQVEQRLLSTTRKLAHNYRQEEHHAADSP